MTFTITNILSKAFEDINSSGNLSITKSDIEYCLMEAIKKDRSYIHMHDVHLNSQEELKFFKLIDNLKKGMPLAYVLGYQEFYNTKFFVNDNVLIPRQDTEIIISKAIKAGDKIYKKYGNTTIIDVGSGSGCIGLSIAAERKNWNIILTEKYQEAFEMLNKNYISNNYKNCELIMCDWLTAFNENIADIIISNPPYIEKGSPYIQESVKKYEPERALYSKDKGLYDIKRIITESRKTLKTNGLLILENGFDQNSAVRKILETNYFKDIDVILDYNNIKRFTLSKNS